ncbi:protein unc-13 homolog isoform X2 [Rhodamnia argentea]|nr:protein unc-13 homolog isoform X2 [Rhodamnia argentea]
MGRRAETIILPLELLRHIKPSEFGDSHEYHIWQKRQLKVLEAGLLLHPSIPLEKSNTFAARLRDVILSGDSKPVDFGKNTDVMRTLCNSVVSLSWRSPSGTPTDICHWADGYPLNVHLYITLLQSIFDVRDETLVLDEVDELLELMKKTWSTLGINRSIHNVCFTWVLFQQYVATSEMEPDLLCASHAMLVEVSRDAKKPDRDAIFVRILSSVLSSMREWSEKRLHHYQDYFSRGMVGLIENILPLALTASAICSEDAMLPVTAAGHEKSDSVLDSTGDRVDDYIRSSLKNEFTKMIKTSSFNQAMDAKQEAVEALLSLAKETEDLALREREYFSPIMKKWHPFAAGVAAVVLHNCYGAVLKRYMASSPKLSSETVSVLQRAGKLENFLVQMVVEDSTECEDGGKSLVREMAPYEVESIILKLLKQWIDEKLRKGKECLRQAKETETWNPKSKTEPYAQSAVELMRLIKETVDEFFDIPIGITEDLIQDLADGLGHLFQDYISFAASCGSKQSYIPSLPPLTRCHRASQFVKIWRNVTPCSVGVEDGHGIGSNDGHNPRPSTSRGTQRLYIRLNSLHYLLTHLHSLNKTLTLSPRVSPSRNRFTNRRQQGKTSSYFDIARGSIQAACQHVSEVAAYRLIFLDSNNVFYENLYAGDVANARIRPVLRTLKQNLTLLCAILTDCAQPLAVKEIMKAAFEAYLMVLLAGGNSRVFYRGDHKMIDEDLAGLKRAFASCGEGLIAEDVVDREAEVVEGVVALLGQATEQLIEDFSILTCETSGIGVMGAGQKLPMPTTTRRWHRSDPNTILRVLCHRNDRAANHFLKKSFRMAKRR